MTRLEVTVTREQLELLARGEEPVELAEILAQLAENARAIIQQARVEWWRVDTPPESPDTSRLTDDQLRAEVVSNRVDCVFGDGLEREYAEAGYAEFGPPVSEMSRLEMLAELEYALYDSREAYEREKIDGSYSEQR